MATTVSVSDMICHWRVLLLSVLLVKNGLVGGCECPAATVLSQFPSTVPADVCCLNFSGSAFSHVSWSVFTNETNIEILDLSSCNISFIGINGSESRTLQEVYLNHNRLTALPRDFLAGQPGLKVLDLSNNLLERISEGFLQDSDNLQVLNLQGNQLRVFPGSVLQKPSLQRLELQGNLWDCSCLFIEGLEEGHQANRTTKLHHLVGNLTCSSPDKVAGRTVWSVRPGDVCRPPGLTALFIVLPLLLLSILVLCWCCGRKKKRKETPAFAASKKGASRSNCNGQKHRTNHLPVAVEQNRTTDVSILKNQLLLPPASTLLGSTRDIYEDVEIKLGSVDSLPRTLSHCSGFTDGRQGSQGPDGAGKGELDTVSVTEVMKDSSDREKAYLTQSTEYYSLVPGIDLEDSDHGDYESVDLS
ncbi:uncharacterized protein LOC142996432 [Genypterus blacodes]|uniref:uncharacterized protein LOC142996432 n=1 Tax=Genypterus blacodes TaxID=154954 RepID=UPI003F7682C5